jgi:hypothetical protein
MMTSPAEPETASDNKTEHNPECDCKADGCLPWKWFIVTEGMDEDSGASYDEENDEHRDGYG